jgi:uncharacterized protein
MSTSLLVSAVFIDGPNIDAVLGNCVLQRKPKPHERPRWDRVYKNCTEWFGAKKPCFVLNGNKFDGAPVFGFRRLLRDIGYDVACPRSQESDPVDNYIVDALDGRVAPDVSTGQLGGVVLFSHDHGYAPALQSILRNGGAVSVVGFVEELAPQLLGLREAGAEILDLEYDFEAFGVKLHRPYKPDNR